MSVRTLQQEIDEQAQAPSAKVLKQFEKPAAKVVKPAPVVNMSIEDKIGARIKCRAYKNEENPDGQLSLCGEPIEVDPENGREFFTIPGHQREYLIKKLPSYEFTVAYDVSDEQVPKLKKK